LITSRGTLVKINIYMLRFLVDLTPLNVENEAKHLFKLTQKDYNMGFY
jgi:hypothetical protein